MSQKPIKSVRRVFEILEMFDRERRPLAAKEIAAELDYPLVSAHALVKSMHELGYLDLGDRKWAYLPSRSLTDRLAWTRDSINAESAVLSFVEALNSGTRETVNLSRRSNVSMQIVHGREAQQAVGVSVKPGTEMPLTHSLTGLTAIAATEQDNVDALLTHLCQADKKQVSRFDSALYRSILTELRNTGAVCRTDLFIEGIGAVCLPITSRLTNSLFVIGVVGPSDRIRQQEREHRRTLKRLVREFEIQSVWKLTTPPRT